MYLIIYYFWYYLFLAGLHPLQKALLLQNQQQQQQQQQHLHQMTPTSYYGGDAVKPAHHIPPSALPQHLAVSMPTSHPNTPSLPSLSLSQQGTPTMLVFLGSAQPVTPTQQLMSLPMSPTGFESAAVVPSYHQVRSTAPWRPMSKLGY